jgi:hypothetical protein
LDLVDYREGKRRRRAISCTPNEVFRLPAIGASRCAIWANKMSPSINQRACDRDARLPQTKRCARGGGEKKLSRVHQRRLERPAKIAPLFLILRRRQTQRAARSLLQVVFYWRGGCAVRERERERAPDGLRERLN